MNRIAEIKCNSYSTEVFNLPGKAIQETHWIKDPANPTEHKDGLIRKGDIVWFEEDLFGSGPYWQQAILNNQTLVYVNPHHFARVSNQSKT